jgi:hypothetical protein
MTNTTEQPVVEEDYDDDDTEDDTVKPGTSGFIELVAENMAIYANTVESNLFVPQARQLVASFEATEGRLPNDYFELEDWSRHHLDKGGRFLVIK